MLLHRLAELRSICDRTLVMSDTSAILRARKATARPGVAQYGKANCCDIGGSLLGRVAQRRTEC
jgi:hypothetical protein